MPQHETDQRLTGPQGELTRLAELHPGVEFTAAWILRHENEGQNRAVVATLEAPVAPPSTGWFLMRVYLTSEQAATAHNGQVMVDLPQVTSRPFSTVWSETVATRESRKFTSSHRPAWPVAS